MIKPTAEDPLKLQEMEEVYHPHLFLLIEEAVEVLQGTIPTTTIMDKVPEVLEVDDQVVLQGAPDLLKVLEEEEEVEVLEVAEAAEVAEVVAAEVVLQTMMVMI